MTDAHDPLPTKLDQEPHFALLSRDALAPGFVRLYAIVRERGPACNARAHAALDAILLANEGRAPRPHKDQQHAWSARAKADQMQQWFIQNMEAKPQSGKLNSTPSTTEGECADQNRTETS